MVQDFSLTSRSSSLADNRFQEFQSSTMTSKRSPKSESLSIPVPRLIDYRFVHITPVSENPPNFEWLAFQGVSNYIVQLSDAKRIVCRDTIHSTQGPIVTYSNATFLEPGKDYIFTVEIDRQYSCVDSCDKQEINIAENVKKSIQKIREIELPRQFVINIIAQLDGLLIARKDILDVIWGVIRQGSNSEIICFIDNFLAQGSAFELLAKSCSFDDILDALGKIASQLAAANLILSHYCYASSVLKSRSIKYFERTCELTSYVRNMTKTENLEPSIFSNKSVLLSQNSSNLGNCSPECIDLLNRYGLIACDSPHCDGCQACNP